MEDEIKERSHQTRMTMWNIGSVVRTERYVEDTDVWWRKRTASFIFMSFLWDATEKIQLISFFKPKGPSAESSHHTLANDVDFDIHCRDCTIDVYGSFEQRFGRPPGKKDFIPFM